MWPTALLGTEVGESGGRGWREMLSKVSGADGNLKVAQVYPMVIFLSLPQCRMAVGGERKFS